MRWLRRLIAGASALAGRERTERELDEELRAYLATAVDEKLRSGMSREEAIRACRLETGLVSADSVKERVRDVGWETRIDTLGQDVRYAGRTLRRNPGFALVTVVTMALGIGATVAIFTVLEGLIVRLWESSPERGLERFEVLSGSFLDWRERSTAFEALAIHPTTPTLVTARGTTERLQTAIGSPALFGVFGVSPVLGRGFQREEGRRTGGRDPADYAGYPEVVISYRLWERKFASDPTVVGQRVTFNGVSDLTIVGVMRPGFDYPRGTEIWGEDILTRGLGRGDRWRDVVGRLKPGVTIEQARAELRTIARQSAAEHPATNAGWTAVVEPLTRVIGGDVRPAFGVLALFITACGVYGVVAFIVSQRTREIGVRVALGARREDVLTLVGRYAARPVIGGVLMGVVAAFWVSRLVAGFVSGTAPVESLVLVAAIAVILLVSAVAVIAPARTALSVDPIETLRNE